MRDRQYWKTLLEQKEEPDDAPQEEASPVEYVDEIVFPYKLTETMLLLYRDPVYNRKELGEVYQEVLIKLLRSAKYWRFDIPYWLVQRVQDLR